MDAPTALAKRGRAAIAQLVEHVIRNDGVGGSNPSCGTTLFTCLATYPGMHSPVGRRTRVNGADRRNRGAKSGPAAVVPAWLQVQKRRDSVP
jgi:hypothetical protein